MSAFAALVRRELGVYFASPMAYIVLTALLFISGMFFVSVVGEYAARSLPLSYEPTLTAILVVVVVSSALVTMRLVAEEKARGTLETALTAPITEAQFVLAKFVAAMGLLGYLVLPTVAFALLVAPYGSLDWGAILCGYLGILLVGAVAYSIGLFISSLCSSQVTAGVITFAVAVVLLAASVLARILPEDSRWLVVVELVDQASHFADFLKGILDVRRLVYIASVVGFFLFLTVRVVGSRRWR